MNQENEKIERDFQNRHWEWILNNYRHPYEKGDKRNKLFVWGALQSCFKFNQPVPEWVQEYFIHAAEELQKIPLEKGEDNKQKMSVWIQDALSLNPGSGKKIFQEYRLHWRNHLIFHKVKDRILNNENSQYVDDIYYEVGQEFDLSDSQVKTIYFQVKDELNAGKINPKLDKENKKKTREYLSNKYGMVFPND
jgi:hypothetical protein